jgi:polyisoprenoid-binding protein YceI
MMVSKVRGRFSRFDGQVVTTPDPADVTVTATIDLTSIDTGNQRRDDHLRSADFFDVARNPTMHYQGRGLRRVDDEWVLDGELTLNYTTKAVPGWASGPATTNRRRGHWASHFLRRRSVSRCSKRRSR